MDWMVFSGSRRMTPAMRQYVERAVKRAMELGRMIVVGDNPEGVDLEVIRVCRKETYKHLMVVVARKDQPARALHYLETREILRPNIRYEEYHARDCHMVRMTDTGIYIWDGQSRGTLAAYEYAVALGREAFLVNFSTGRPILTKALDMQREPH